MKKNPEQKVDEYSSRKDAPSLRALALELYDAGTINDVLSGARAASLSYGIHPENGVLDSASKAALGIPAHFMTEMDRYFREHGIDGNFSAAFRSSAGNGERKLGYERSNAAAVILGFRKFKALYGNIENAIKDIGFTRGYTLNWDSEPERFSRNYAKALATVAEKEGPFRNLVIFNFSCGIGNERIVVDYSEEKPVLISYRTLFNPLRGHHGNILFLNCACNSGSAIAPLTELGLLPERIGMIYGDSTEHDIGDGVFTYAFKRFMAGVNFEPANMATGDIVIDLSEMKIEKTRQNVVPIVRTGADNGYLLINFDARK